VHAVEFSRIGRTPLQTQQAWAMRATDSCCSCGAAIDALLPVRSDLIGRGDYLSRTAHIIYIGSSPAASCGVCPVWTDVVPLEAEKLSRFPHLWGDEGLHYGPSTASASRRQPGRVASSMGGAAGSARRERTAVAARNTTAPAATTVGPSTLSPRRIAAHTMVSTGWTSWT